MVSDPNYVLGWFAAFVGMLGFGSFAVPIKGDAANSVDIDPLVMQSYKSLMCLWVWYDCCFVCLLLCHVVVICSCLLLILYSPHLWTQNNDHIVWQAGLFCYLAKKWRLHGGALYQASANRIPIPAWIKCFYVNVLSSLIHLYRYPSICRGVLGARRCLQYICNSQRWIGNITRYRCFSNCHGMCFNIMMSNHQCNIFSMHRVRIFILTLPHPLKVSFIWGNIIFREPVKSQMIAYAAVWLIMAGLYGMSYFSTAESLETERNQPSPNQSESDGEEEEGLMNSSKRSDIFDNEASSLPSQPLEIAQSSPSRGRSRSILVCGKTVSRRNLGLLAALMCGLWGGSCLVPMHYSTGDTNGLGYVISFSVGAMGECDAIQKRFYHHHDYCVKELCWYSCTIFHGNAVVTILMWVLRFTYQLFKLRSFKEAFEVLPSFHFRIMWLPGATAGSLWSLGNVGSIVAVEHLGEFQFWGCYVLFVWLVGASKACLTPNIFCIQSNKGQGVGYSASQAALLVSGKLLVHGSPLSSDFILHINWDKFS